MNRCNRNHNAQTYAFKVSVVVRPTARVHYQGIEYSIPGHAVGQTNIAEHLTELQTTFQQQHQAKMTEELLDIGSGFEVLNQIH